MGKWDVQENLGVKASIGVEVVQAEPCWWKASNRASTIEEDDDSSTSKTKEVGCEAYGA